MNLSREEYTTLASDLAKPLVNPPHLHGADNGLSPAGEYSALAKQGGALLESIEGPTRLGRYSFIATDPPLVPRFRGDQVELGGDPRFNAIGTAPKESNPVERLESEMNRSPMQGPGSPHLQAG